MPEDILAASVDLFDNAGKFLHLFYLVNMKTENWLVCWFSLVSTITLWKLVEFKGHWGQQSSNSGNCKQDDKSKQLGWTLHMVCWSHTLSASSLWNWGGQRSAVGNVWKHDMQRAELGWTFVACLCECKNLNHNRIDGELIELLKT